MLKGVCGCKLVEGIDEEIRCKPDRAKTKGLKFANYNKLNNQGVIPENTKIDDRDIVIAKTLPIKENRNNHISMVNGDVMGNSVSSSSGVSSRVYKDGNWGFSSSPDLSDSAVEYVVKNASDNVMFMNRRQKEQCGFILPDISGHHEIDLSTQHIRNDQKQWIEFLRNIDDYISDDDTPFYKTSSNNYSSSEEKSIPYSSGISFTEYLISQLKTISPVSYTHLTLPTKRIV